MDASSPSVIQKGKSTSWCRPYYALTAKRFLAYGTVRQSNLDNSLPVQMHPAIPEGSFTGSQWGVMETPRSEPFLAADER